MRHGKSYRKLGRTSSHRAALLRNQLASLIEHERIITTLPKAKELRPIVEKTITLGKEDSRPQPPARRQLASSDDDLVKKLFDTSGRASRPSGRLHAHHQARLPPRRRRRDGDPRVRRFPAEDRRGRKPARRPRPHRRRRPPRPRAKAPRPKKAEEKPAKKPAAKKAAPKKRESAPKKSASKKAAPKKGGSQGIEARIRSSHQDCHTKARGRRGPFSFCTPDRKRPGTGAGTSNPLTPHPFPSPRNTVIRFSTAPAGERGKVALARSIPLSPEDGHPFQHSSRRGEGLGSCRAGTRSRGSRTPLPGEGKNPEASDGASGERGRGEGPSVTSPASRSL